MRYSASEKHEILQLVEHSNLSVRQTLRKLGVSKSTYYNWLKRYYEQGVEGLEDKKPTALSSWNRIPDQHRDALVELALEETTFSPRELAVRYTDENSYFLSESSAYRVLKAHDLITSPAYILMEAADRFQQPTLRVNQLWQTDFTYFKVIDWGWYYLSTVLDDYSRFIIAWKLCTSMTASDVEDTLDLALQASGAQQVSIKHRPRLLSDNGPCYVSSELADYLESEGMAHTRGRPYHPQTQGKIERWHQSMKNQVLLNHYYSPSELEGAIGRFVEYYNHHRNHESINNLMPAQVYYGRDQEILEQRELIKMSTLASRRAEHYARVS